MENRFSGIIYGLKIQENFNMYFPTLQRFPLRVNRRRACFAIRQIAFLGKGRLVL